MNKKEKLRKTRRSRLKWKSLTHSNKGFTVVETLIALTILATAVVIFLVGLTAGSRTVALTYEKTTAENLARSQLEYTKSQNYVPVPSSYSIIPSVPSDFSVSVLASQVAGRDNNLQKITVSVYHDRKLVLTLEDLKLNR
jgi:type II secretory pathway pseudopilin PulG